MGSDDHSPLIVKRKRTKRQRSSSPHGVAALTERERGGVVVDDSYNSVSSPTTSGEIYESTEEEEDMANCLIMLAQGDASRQIQQQKVSSIITSTSSKAGFYVYECKTCNRSFPSFQALGGHRASHKKPKLIIEEKKSPVVAAEVNGDSVEETANSKANKIHECSICGSEFTSGQALGGHMRRHRATAAATVVNQVGGGANNSEAIRSILPLDLNLPAPPEDHDHSKFQFGSTQQALVFSASALVDCHY
ncbi:hypothetical protein Patl1_30561 [Pistacia atlantica]|uniref:Uncharacterized protein n=1 Tax=Pistacia atlantica TaxID=434234 RepID=A0ACC1AB91_9ROSI|nr:hypothetical protein Patl1_30561 [Pistacia atlantica]